MAMLDEEERGEVKVWEGSVFEVLRAEEKRVRVREKGGNGRGGGGKEVK